MSAELTAVRLTRRTSSSIAEGTPQPPVRIVHLGVGSFVRAHLAWYTSRAVDSAQWGIAGFTGRSPDIAQKLSPQGGMYTLVERGEDGDKHELIASIVSVHAGDRVGDLLDYLASPTVAIVTLTITEAGYRLLPGGQPDPRDPALAADTELLKDVMPRGAADIASASPTTALGRLLLGLEARRRAEAGPIAVMSCDNLPDNGGHLRTGLTAIAQTCAPWMVRWISRNVSFVSTSVDRITPRTTEADIEAVTQQTGWIDAAPVVTEPFSDWVVCGEFPAGRPDWESAGARFVDDIAPYETRKLWMLNGAHTLLAYLGQVRGHATVADAIHDPVCREAVEQLWDEDERHLPDGLSVGDYRKALLQRFANRRIEHRLEQIAVDPVLKLSLRVAPVAARELAIGQLPTGCLTAIAAWIAAIERGLTPDDEDVHRTAGSPDSTGSLLALVAPTIATVPSIRQKIDEIVEGLR